MADKVKNAAQGSTTTQANPPTPTPTAPAPTAPAQTGNGKGRKKNGTPIDPNETKAQRFRRLANARVPKVLRMFGHIENLTRSGSYEYTDEQADKIIAVLSLAFKRIVDGFRGQAEKPGGFSL